MFVRHWSAWTRLLLREVSHRDAEADFRWFSSILEWFPREWWNNCNSWWMKVHGDGSFGIVTNPCEWEPSTDPNRRRERCGTGIRIGFEEFRPILRRFHRSLDWNCSSSRGDFEWNCIRSQLHSSPPGSIEWNHPKDRIEVFSTSVILFVLLCQCYSLPTFDCDILNSVESNGFCSSWFLQCSTSDLFASDL